MAVRDCNQGFCGYDFSAATKALYNFWLYELCDVYFESLKPVVYGENEEAKTVSRNVLYPMLLGTYNHDVKLIMEDLHIVFSIM